MNVIDKVLVRITPEEMTQTIRSMGIASLIADAMEAKGLSHREFAKKIGKKTADIPVLLRGHYNYTIEELTQIEYVLDTKLFFSKTLDWWTPEEVVKKPNYYSLDTPEPLLSAAEPKRDPSVYY
jgi:transcriptional regulator with XRE-family HTH domain